MVVTASFLTSRFYYVHLLFRLILVCFLSDLSCFYLHNFYVFYLNLSSLSCVTARLVAVFSRRPVAIMSGEKVARMYTLLRTDQEDSRQCFNWSTDQGTEGQAYNTVGRGYIRGRPFPWSWFDSSQPVMLRLSSILVGQLSLYLSLTFTTLSGQCCLALSVSGSLAPDYQLLACKTMLTVCELIAGHTLITEPAPMTKHSMLSAAEVI